MAAVFEQNVPVGHLLKTYGQLCLFVNENILFVNGFMPTRASVYRRLISACPGPHSPREFSTGMPGRIQSRISAF